VRSIATGDLNKDGILDIVVGNSGTTTVSIFLGKGDGTFASQAVATVGSAPYGVAVADLNGDSILDIITANYTGASVSVLTGKSITIIGARSSGAIPCVGRRGLVS